MSNGSPRDRPKAAAKRSPRRPRDAELAVTQGPFGTFAHVQQKDPYRVLGIPYGASDAVVLDAYRRLTKLHHPDRNGGSEESTRRFQEIQRAYETLRGRPAPDETIEERLKRMEEELGGPKARDRGTHESVTAVSDLMDGLDGLSSQLDRF